MGVPAPTPAPTPADPSGTGPAPAPTPPAPAPAPSNQPAPFDPANLAPEVKAYIAQQTADANHKARTQARDTAAQTARTELLATISKALGQDTVADPAALTTQLSQQATANKTLTIQNALLSASFRNGADGDMMAAVLTYNGKLAQLDPAAPDFAAQVDATVKAELASNPRLALVQGAPAPAPAAGGASSSAMQLGGNTDKITEEQLRAMAPGEIAEAMRKGELAHLL